ncbi:nucleoporin 88-like isoform X1 [Ornithodoros turicata]|uniref:nucleoporin 88-like isoform X1 n=1 Tax=Ornithodoros turicata TaxID=34597 RepID=UPI00313A350E
MAAPWKWCEAGSSFLNKLAQNGDGYCSSVHARNLIAVYDDLLLAWNQKDQDVLAVSVRNSAQNVAKDDFQVLVLTNPPPYEVDNVLTNRTHHLLLWGPRGVTVVLLPKATVLKEKAVCRSWPIGEHFFLCNKSVVVTDVAWHPDSETDSHILVLTSDNHLRLYNISEPQAPQLMLPVGVCHGLSSSIGASLGEDTAVSFDFGQQLECSKSRQVFILMGSGDVYLTHISSTDENSTMYSGRVMGPLNMQPPSEDNYGVDGYSLLCLPSPVPVLVIATTAGTLYHCLALGMPQQQPFNQNRGEVDTVLFAFEKVKLDLTFTPGNEDDAFVCPVRLTRDPTCPLRYTCSHNSGLHAVALPVINHLHTFAQSEDNAGVPPLLRNEPCIVESLICTRATTSTLPTPLVGALVLPRVPGPVLIVFTASWKIVINFLVQGYQGYVPQLFSSVPSTVGASLQRPERSSFEQQVQQLLGGRTVPQLIQGTSGESSLQECLEILFAATHKFREEWLQRLDSCQVLIRRRMQTVNMQKDEQLEKEEKLRKEFEQIQANVASLREKYDAAYGTQQKIIKRAENVLHHLQQQVPQLSKAEQEMQKELEGLEERLKGMETSLEQARLKRDYQERHMESRGEEESVVQYINNAQIENIRKALSTEGKTISDLVQTITQLKQELSL